MEKEYKVCCVTGHRPKGFPWDYRNSNSSSQKWYPQIFRRIIENFIKKDGFNYFITGCAIGVDLDFAEICIELRDTMYPDIVIEGAIPCDGQDSRWSKSDKERYANVIKKLNKVHYVSHECTMSCYQKRNEYMVDRSQLVVAVWNGEKKGGTWNTIEYAKKTNKKIDYLLLSFISDNPEYFEKALDIVFRSNYPKKNPERWSELTQIIDEVCVGRKN